MGLRIRCVNKSSALSDTEFREVVAGLRVQTKDLQASDWGVDIDVLVSRRAQADAELTFMDRADVAGALGYHWTTPDGLPYGVIGVLDDRDAGLSVSVTASHELLEMAGDLPASAAGQVTDMDWAAWELCDPVEADRDGYEAGGVQVSNFILPSWFISGSPGPWDFRGQLNGPLRLRRGGYIAWWNPQQGWTNQFAATDEDVESVRSRRARRVLWRAARARIGVRGLFTPTRGELPAVPHVAKPAGVPLG